MIQNVAPSVAPVQNVVEQPQQVNPEPVKEAVQQTVPSEEALSNEGQNTIAKEHPVFAPDPSKLVENELIKTAEEQRGAVPIAASEVHEVTTEDQKQIVQQNAAAFAVPPGTEVKNLKSQTDVNNLARQVGEQKQEEMKMSNDKKRFVEAISEYVNGISDEESLVPSRSSGRNGGIRFSLLLVQLQLQVSVIRLSPVTVVAVMISTKKMQKNLSPASVLSLRNTILRKRDRKIRVPEYSGTLFFVL